MKSFVIILLLSFSSLAGKSQDVVEWKFSVKKINDLKYEVHLLATVEDEWHIYSQGTPDGGPLATEIILKKNPLVVPVGKPREEGDMEISHDETFGVDVHGYSGKVDFVQTIKLKAKAKTKVNGTVQFMACRNGQCLTPQKIPFSLALQ